MRKLSDNRNVFDVAARLADPHRGNLISVVGMGIGAATILAIYGLACAMTQEATFFGSRPIKIVKYSGTPAICLGAAYISVAVFMHAHFTWSSSNRYHGFGEFGKIVSAASFVIAIGCLLVDFATYS